MWRFAFIIKICGNILALILLFVSFIIIHHPPPSASITTTTITTLSFFTIVRNESSSSASTAAKDHQQRHLELAVAGSHKRHLRYLAHAQRRLEYSCCSWSCRSIIIIIISSSSSSKTALMLHMQQEHAIFPFKQWETTAAALLPMNMEREQSPGQSAAVRPASSSLCHPKD